MKRHDQLGRRIFRIGLVVVLIGTLAGCNWFANFREEKKGIQLDRLRTAAGYKTSVLTADIPKARQMVLGNRGTLFVGSNAGKVHALTLDANRVVQARTLAMGLNDGSAVAFHNGALFYSDRTRLLRMDDIENRLDNPPAPVTVVDGLPNEERHGARFMMIGPDNKLYISVGSPCNLCESPNDQFGHVLRVNPDGSGREIFARGIRNTVGFDFHPQTRALWFTENGQDDLGNERPNDELNRVSKVGEHFGFLTATTRRLPIRNSARSARAASSRRRYLGWVRTSLHLARGSTRGTR